MATTEVLLETMGPDVSITKMEVFDVDFARQLAEDKNVPKSDRDLLRKYLKNREGGRFHNTTYKLGRLLKHEFLGRFCAVRGESLQSMSRDIRNALASQFYWDLDFVNAQPSLLRHYAEARGWKCDAVKAYSERREELLSEVCEALGCERWYAKEKVIKLFFGAGVGEVEGMPDFFVRELYPELRNIMKNNWEHNKAKLKWLEKHPNSVGKGLADILQTEERTCLLALDKALSKKGRSMDVYIHDGGLVRKKEGEAVFPAALLRELEAEVERETGYKLGLAIKPMRTTFEKKNEEDDYAEKKVQWEQTGWKGATYFKLRNPATFVMVEGSKITQMSRTDLLQNEEDNKLSDGSLFLKRWLEDEDKLEYNRCDFKPKLEVPNGIYNTFRGFPCEAKEGDFGLYTELLNLLVNHNKEHFEYVENWLAHIVQKPYERTEVVVIFKGKKGCGKDRLVNAFGYNLLGDYYLSTGKPEHDLFGRFTSTARKIVIKIEEGNFQVNKEFEERFKNLITAVKDTIEQKGKDPIELDSYANYMMTTNQDVPVMLTDDERRFAMFEVSEERRGDLDYWMDVTQKLKNPALSSAYMNHLLKKDLTGFNPRKFPKTEAFQDALQSFIPYHARWFQTTLEGNESEEVEWKARSLFGSMKSSSYVRFDLTETKFGLDMRKEYVRTGILEKVAKGDGAYYKTSPAKLTEYLKSKNWWVNF